MNIVILNDGNYGDRAAIVVKKIFPSTILKVLEERDPTMFLDEVALAEDVEIAIKNADLLILYVRHPDVVAEMVEKREVARKVKNWEMADQIRKDLLDMGIILEDRADGPIWKINK